MYSYLRVCHPSLSLVFFLSVSEFLMEMAACSVLVLCVFKPENRCIQHKAAAVEREWSDSAPSKPDSCSVRRINPAELAHRPWTPHTSPHSRYWNCCTDLHIPPPIHCFIPAYPVQGCGGLESIPVHSEGWVSFEIIWSWCRVLVPVFLEPPVLVKWKKGVLWTQAAIKELCLLKKTFKINKT